MTPADQQIAFIGAGNVATHMAKALRNADMKIKAVYSHTIASAQTLAAEVEADAIDDIADLPEADIFVYCVKDDVLPEIAAINSLRFPNALHIHTSGSTPANVFLNQWHGVIYPMQTFSKNAALNFSEVRCYIEGSNRQSLEMIGNLARSLTSHVSELDTEARLCLHAAAVFACNFANHCFALAEKLLKEKAGIPFETLLPLIDETVRKAHHLSPVAAQTGPAVRFDQNIINKHLEMLDDMPQMKNIYRTMTESICHTALETKKLKNDAD